MKEKTIYITLTEQSSLIVPGHLKGQPALDVKVNGFNELEAIQMTISVLSGLMKEYKAKVDAMTNEFNKGNQPN